MNKLKFSLYTSLEFRDIKHVRNRNYTVCYIMLYLFNQNYIIHKRRRYLEYSDDILGKWNDSVGLMALDGAPEEDKANLAGFFR